MSISELPKRAVNKMYRIISAPILDIKARKNLKNIKNKKTKKDRINVLFIVQMPELWDKQKRVFELMKDNERFEPRLLIVPKYDFINSRIGSYGEELDFFSSFDEHAVCVSDINDYEVFLRNYDYVFYQRQYNHYLPKFLWNDTVIKYTKTCYIPYATPDLKKTGLYEKEFYRNIYLGFLESEYAKKILINKFDKNVGNGIQKFVFKGYPAFEEMLTQNSEYLAYRVLWTPRWSYDSIVGGSHFFEYYKHINQYAKENSNLSVCIRPHPMMFENFIKENRMNKNDVDAYIKDVQSSGVSIDDNKNINDTFQNTDILISDRSSIIPMFFLTGKPIVYCPFDLECSYLFETIMPGLYIANKWDDLRHILDHLIEGKDELKEIRCEIIQKYFISNINASQNIVDTIYSDYYEGAKL